MAIFHVNAARMMLQKLTKGTKDVIRRHADILLGRRSLSSNQIIDKCHPSISLPIHPCPSVRTWAFFEPHPPSLHSALLGFVGP